MDSIVMMTERLSLRKMTTDDLGNLMRIFSDEEAMRYYPSTMDEEEAMGWILRTLDNYDRFGVGFWIVEDKVDNRFLGQCGIIPQELDGVRVWEIAYLFVRRVWGNGYATEAAAACKEYGFQTLGCRKMYSFIDADNLASTRVAERNGMKIEKSMSKWNKDVLVYSTQEI